MTRTRSSHTLCRSYTYKRLKPVKGFTLIEVLIVVAIIGILAAIAYPSYGSYVQKSRRSDAHLALLQEIQNLERCKSTAYSYAACTLMSSTSAEGHYTITLPTKTATTYTVKATATGSQAADDDCEEMTIDHTGARTPAAANKCWPK